MIVWLHYLDGSMEERKTTAMPDVLVRPGGVVFVPSGPKDMRELGPRERVTEQPRRNPR